MEGQEAIGQYGNGFKSGSMRLGADVLTFTIKNGIKTVGFLSRSFLGDIDAPEVYVPIASWNREWEVISKLVLHRLTTASCMIQRPLL